MYDIDQQRSVLRLGSISETPSPLTTSERLALAERQMEEAIKHWVSATIDYAAERRQSQPISAVRHPILTPEEVEHYSGERWSEEDVAHMRQNVGDGAVRF